MRARVAQLVYAVAVLLCAFILSAAAVGLWAGLVLRFVWVTAP